MEVLVLFINARHAFQHADGRCVLQTLQDALLLLRLDPLDLRAAKISLHARQQDIASQILDTERKLPLGVRLVARDAEVELHARTVAEDDVEEADTVHAAKRAEDVLHRLLARRFLLERHLADLEQIKLVALKRP